MDIVRPGDSIVVGNARIELVFSPQGSLIGLRNREEGFAFELGPGREKTAGQSALWQVILRSTEGRSVVVEPTRPPVSMAASEDRSSLLMEWREQVEGTEIRTLVKVAVGQESPLSHWRCEVSYSGPLSVWEVTCPCLSGLGPIVGDGSGDRLAIPWQYGGIVPNPIQCIAEGGSHAYGISMDYGFYDAEGAVGKKQSRIAYSYPGMWSMQFLAFYSAEYGGIYLGAHDPGARYKRFGLYGDRGSERADLVMQHYPDERLDPGLDYSTPYDTVVGLFKGDWWQASRLYGDWALAQEWCQRGPLAQRSDIPEWLLDTDIWYWNWRPNERLGNHGRPGDLVPAILDLRQRLGGEMAFHWYEWDGRSFNQDMPEVFPLDAADAAELLEGLERLHQGGVRAIPYINGRLWTTGHPGWKQEGAPLACRTPEGEVAWYDNLEGIAQICPYTSRWQEIVKEMCQVIVGDYGLDGAYIDQITSCYVVPCFAANHGHPRGGGNSWYLGHREMMERIQQEIQGQHPEAVSTSESTIDCYLDLFDGNLAREASEMSDAHGDQWLPIPLFHSVYHDYALTYGSVLQLTEEYPDAYYYGEALVLTGGQQLMVEGYMAWDIGTDHYAEYLSYLRKLVQAHRAARRFLLYGRWMPPVVTNVDRVQVRWSRTRPPKKGIPAVLGSAWYLDGSLCLVFVNHTDQERTIQYRLPLGEYGLAGDGCVLYDLTEGTESPVERLAGETVERREQIAARSPRVLACARTC